MKPGRLKYCYLWFLTRRKEKQTNLQKYYDKSCVEKKILYFIGNQRGIVIHRWIHL